MARLIKKIEGVRGRTLELYDTKCVIETKVTVGSVLTHNATDGKKTIFLKDVVGVQFKKSGLLIGYIQFETPSMQMNNTNSNTFSENTFTFEEGKNGVTNESMERLYNYIVDQIEALKYGTECPEIENVLAKHKPNTTQRKNEEKSKDTSDNIVTKVDLKEMYIDIICPNCKEEVSFEKGSELEECYFCGHEINLSQFNP